VKQRRMIWVSALLLCSVTACAWVKPTPGGAQVREATAAEVAGCEELGTASGTTQATAAGLPRNKEVVRDEQVTLARNQAAVIGGDTIVANGPPQGGMLAFIVYRCR
jgi:Domain of unknown function (DUF4156)